MAIGMYSVDPADSRRTVKMTSLKTLSVRHIFMSTVLVSTFLTLAFFYIPLTFGDLQTLRQSLKSSRVSSSTLDIIVSMYKEDAEALAATLNDLRALSPIQNITEIRTFIYVKDADANVTELKTILNATSVIRLPNVGREGSSYLAHIERNWEDLARHSMFIQAEMHELEGAKGRILDYFSPSTGLLPLGVLETCTCVSCSDPWDASRTFPRLEELYSNLNQRFCPKTITLSYFAQTIVSQKRIHMRPLQAYVHLRETLESGIDHFIHSDPRQEGAFHDDPSNPYFGHTVERAYTLLWGCEDVGLRCGGWDRMRSRRKEDDTDDQCQCMDN